MQNKTISISIAFGCLLLSFVVIELVSNHMRGADSRVSQNETKERGVLAAKQATRYLREARAASIKTNFNAPEVDQKWRWARQTADEAKQAGIDSDIVDNLYCALAAFAIDVVADTSSAEAAKCLINAENRLSERYGK